MVRPHRKEVDIQDVPAELARAAEAGLSRLVAEYDRPDTPYFAASSSGRAQRWNDYAHLARLKEWSVPGRDGG